MKPMVHYGQPLMKDLQIEHFEIENEFFAVFFLG